MKIRAIKPAVVCIRLPGWQVWNGHLCLYRHLNAHLTVVVLERWQCIPTPRYRLTPCCASVTYIHIIPHTLPAFLCPGLSLQVFPTWSRFTAWNSDVTTVTDSCHQRPGTPSLRGVVLVEVKSKYCAATGNRLFKSTEELCLHQTS